MSDGRERALQELYEAVDRAALEVVRRAARGGEQERTVTTKTITDADGNATTTTTESVRTLLPDANAARWLLEHGIKS